LELKGGLNLDENHLCMSAMMPAVLHASEMWTRLKG